jgi:putative oxidoreductase
MQSTPPAALTSAGLLILRLGIGGYMLTHGWGKVQRVIAGEFEGFPDPFGLGSTGSLLLVAFAEFVCALLVMAGLATRLAAVPIAFAMGVAAFWAHGADPWTMGRAAELYAAGEAEHAGSKQPALMYMTVFLALIFTGPGRLSVDAILWPKLRRSKTLKVEPEDA